MGEVRIRKINKLILQQVGKILLQEVHLQTKAMITVKKVSTTKDLTYADVWISIMPETSEEDVLAELDRQIGDIQHLLNRKLSLRFVPWVRFKIDDSEEKAQHLHTLIRHTVADDDSQSASQDKLIDKESEQNGTN